MNRYLILLLLWTTSVFAANPAMIYGDGGRGLMIPVNGIQFSSGVLLNDVGTGLETDLNFSVDGTFRASTSLNGIGKFTSGVLSASALDLSTDVTGVLPIANGGTGSVTQNFIDLTTDQSAAGNKTLSGETTLNATSVNPSVSISNLGAGDSIESTGSNVFLDTLVPLGTALLEVWNNAKTISYFMANAAWTYVQGDPVVVIDSAATNGQVPYTNVTNGEKKHNFSLAERLNEKIKDNLIVNPSYENIGSIGTLILTGGVNLSGITTRTLQESAHNASIYNITATAAHTLDYSRGSAEDFTDRQMVAYCEIRTDRNDVYFKVFPDGSTELTKLKVNNDNKWRYYKIPFSGDSGPQLLISSEGNSATGNTKVDNCFLGVSDNETIDKVAAIPVVWELNGDISPLEETLSGISALSFDSELESEIWAFIQVPESYKSGQIKLLGASFTSAGGSTPIPGAFSSVVVAPGDFAVEPGGVTNNLDGFTITADNEGTAGDFIDIMPDGSNSVSGLVDLWNLSNPSNTATLVFDGGIDNFEIPVMGTLFSMSGGVDPSASETVLFRCQTFLNRAGQALNYQNHISVNAEVSLITPNVINSIGEIDLTDVNGAINSVQVLPNDYIAIRLYRDIANETVSSPNDARFLKFSASISFTE